MKFGSCIELTLPRGTEIYVETGMKVRAASRFWGGLG